MKSFKTRKKGFPLSRFKQSSRKKMFAGGGEEEGEDTERQLSTKVERQFSTMWNLRQSNNQMFTHQLIQILKKNVYLREKKDLAARLLDAIWFRVDSGLPDSVIYDQLIDVLKESKEPAKKKKIKIKRLHGGSLKENGQRYSCCAQDDCNNSEGESDDRDDREFSGGAMSPGDEDLELVEKTKTKIKTNTRTQKTHELNVKGRAVHRVNRFMELLEKLKNTPANLLDVGCSEGNITAELGKALGLPPKSVFGCDILPGSEISSTGFQYKQSQENKLPYENKKFDLVVCAMSMHHFRNQEMFSELSRVCKEEGYLLIREHDCQPEDRPWLPVALDIMHGMWSLVWPVVDGKKKEDEDFCQNYWAKYRSRQEWDNLLLSHGFRTVLSGDENEGRLFSKRYQQCRSQPAREGVTVNPMNVYHKLYRLGEGGIDEVANEEKSGVEKSRMEKTELKKKGADKKITHPFIDGIIKDSLQIKKGKGKFKKWTECPDYSLFETMGKVSGYSSLLPKYIEPFRQILGEWKETIGTVDHFLDATAHIGCDSVFFAAQYPGSTGSCVELDDKTCSVLEDNIQRFSLEDRLNVYCGSCVTLVNKIATSTQKRVDLLYLDPPWGGRDYIEADTISLKLDHMSVVDLIKSWLNNGVANNVIYKTPINIDRVEIDTINSLPGWKVVGPKEIKASYRRAKAKGEQKGLGVSYLLWLICQE